MGEGQEIVNAVARMLACVLLVIAFWTLSLAAGVVWILA